MKIFHCDHCGHLLFFENTECVSCRHRVAFLPDLRLVGSLDPDGADKWRSPLPRAAEGGYRLCQNYALEVGLQLGRARRGRQPALRVMPNHAGDPQSCRSGEPRRVVPPRGRQATSAVHAHRARCADPEPGRRSGTGVDVRVSRGCRSGHAGVDWARRRRHHRQHRRGRRRRA